MKKFNTWSIFSLVIAPLVALGLLFSNIAAADTSAIQYSGWTPPTAHEDGSPLDLATIHYEMDVTYAGRIIRVKIPGDGTITTYDLPMATLAPVCSQSMQTVTAVFYSVETIHDPLTDLDYDVSSIASDPVVVSNVSIACSRPLPPTGVTATTLGN